MLSNLKRIGKTLFSSTAPGAFERWQCHRRRKHDSRFAESIGLPGIAAEYISKHGMKVLHGPFKDLCYPSAISTGSVLVPKLLGSYEAELGPSLESLLTERYTTVVDIGCAEGFYATGLARRLETAHVFAYDIDPHAQALCREMVEHNGVSASVTVRGRATFEELSSVMVGRTLVICDCDGGETAILDPLAVNAMRTADLVVEVHDFMDEAITPTLKARFFPTHSIEYVASVPKDPDDYPEISFFILEDRLKAINEFRSQQGWLIMRAREKR